MAEILPVAFTVAEWEHLRHHAKRLRLTEQGVVTMIVRDWLLTTEDPYSSHRNDHMRHVRHGTRLAHELGPEERKLVYGETGDE